jgi:7TMR-DISM extracellular 2
MKSVLFAFVLLVFSASLAAQKVDTLSSDYQKLYKSFQILADKGYSIEQITTDSTLSFQALSAIKPSEMGIFWVKLMVYNPTPYAERRFAQFFPVLDNTLYYHDEQQNKWQAARNGLEVPNNQHDFFIYPCVLQAQKNNVIYIKADVRHLQAAADSSVRPAFRLDNEVQVIQRKRDVDMATAVTVMLVFAFFFGSLTILAVALRNGKRAI